MFAIVLALVGCASPVDVTLRLPEEGTLLLAEKIVQKTRTPMGPSELAITSTKRLELLDGGRVGVDELSWIADTVRYSVRYSSPSGEVEWTLPVTEEEKEDAEELPAALAAFAPGPRRQMWVTPGREVFIQLLPEPDPDEEEAVEEPPAGAEEPEPEPPPKTRATDTEIENYMSGMFRMPSEPITPRTEWSWSQSQIVRVGKPITTSSTWRFERVQGSNAIFVETIELSGSVAPAAGDFATTGLTGAGELRIDVATGIPVQYDSKYEASLASPSARGSSTLVTEARFKYKPPR